MEHLITLEKTLLYKPTRHDVSVLEKYLADDFYEFGSTGNGFGKRECIESLPKEPSTTVFEGYDFEVRAITPDVGLVTFKVIKKTANGDSKSIRSSLWAKKGEEWQMVFHQGTPLKE